MSNRTVTVDAATLQDLIFNAGLATAGMGDMEGVVSEQCDTLQACIDDQVGDCNVVYGRNLPSADGIELAFIPNDDPKVVALFGAR